MTTVYVAQCSATCTRSSQQKYIRNKQVSALDGALDEAQNEVDSEAEDDIYGSEMDDIKTYTPLSSPIPKKISFANTILYISVFELARYAPILVARRKYN